MTNGQTTKGPTPMADMMTLEEIKAAILRVPIRFRDDPNGGMCDEIPVYIAEHHAENAAD